MKTIFSVNAHKRGLATVLGMLVTVGVFISAVIPLFLYVNNVNSFYDENIEEMTFQDQLKASEEIDVFAYPVGENFTMMNVQVKNIGSTPVKVVRIWISEITIQTSQFWNETHLPALQDQIPPATQTTFSNLSLATFFSDEMLLSVKLTTERGRTFASGSNPIWISEGGWSGDYSYPYNIQFVFDSPKGQGTWKIEGEIKVWYNKTIDPDNLDATYYKSTVMDQLVQGNIYMESVGIPYEGTYHIIVDVTNPTGFGEVYDDTLLVTSYNPLRWLFIPLKVPQE
jgi:hypothetical protein